MNILEKMEAADKCLKIINFYWRPKTAVIIEEDKSEWYGNERHIWQRSKMSTNLFNL